MGRMILRLVVVLGLVAAPVVLAQAPDPEIAKGIKLVDEGDYDGAILTLDNAARRLATDPNKAKDLSQAYLYLGIAYVGKGHEAAAKAKFREAIGQIKDLSLSPDKFPPKVIDLFEAARQEASKAPAPPPPPKKGGGNKKLLLIGGGVVVAAGAGVAIAASGGDSGGGSERSETFTGSITAEEYERVFNFDIQGTGPFSAEVSWNEANAVLSMNFFDVSNQDNWIEVASSSRTTNTSARLTASVSGKRYALNLHHDGGCDESPGCVATFQLTVRHP